MNQQFTIDQRLPGLNEVIAENRKSPHAGARLKAQTDAIIGWCVREARLKPVKKRCIVHMTFFEPNQRRDVDNVESAKKFILDALVKQGILESDSPKYVSAAPSYTRYGSKQSRVIVTLVEDEDDELKRRMMYAEIALVGKRVGSDKYLALPGMTIVIPAD